MVKKIIIDEDYLNENRTQLLNNAPLNYLYGKEVFFTAGFNQNKSILFQMIGNLGAYANDYEYDDSINVFVLSDSYIEQMKNGFIDEILKKVERKLNIKRIIKNGPLSVTDKVPLPITKKNLLVITTSTLIDFVKKRISFYGDKVTQELINALQGT
jgi:hypothetical protein